MNENIKKVLFGNQKQSLRQNEAIVNFVESYLDDGDFSTLDSVRESILKGLEYCAEYAADNKILDKLEDRLFVEYILGVDGRKAMEGDCDCELKWKSAGDNGKIIFYVDPDGDGSSEEYCTRLRQQSDYINSEDGEKASGSEDWICELIRNILAVTPIAVRKQLPEDDAMAAVAVSREYWDAHR